MKHTPPTRIRVLGAETPIGKFLVAKLCELGYDVVLSDRYKSLPPYDKFYNIVWSTNDPRLYQFANFIFVANEVGVEIEYLYLYRKFGVSLEDFINFCIFCWGMERGNRLPSDNKIEVTPEKIEKWKLTNLL